NGHSQRARSSRASCPPSDSWAQYRCPQPRAVGSLLFCSGCANSAGPRVATSSSSIAGRREAAIGPSSSLPSSSDLKSISLSHMQPPIVLAAKRATSVIPTVFAATADPVGTGLVASLAHPGGNVTGLSVQHTDLAGKRLELLREIVPNLRRLAIMTNVGNPAAMLELREVQAAARTLGLEVAALEIRRAEDIARAFEEVKVRAEALYVCIDALLFFQRILINTLALAARLPTMHGNREHVATGGLAHYGANYPDLFRPAGDYVDKILRGAKPGGIPVEQPTRFDLVVNLTTAKALGLTIPESFLLRADEVIE